MTQLRSPPLTDLRESAQRRYENYKSFRSWQTKSLIKGTSSLLFYSTFPKAKETKQKNNNLNVWKQLSPIVQAFQTVRSYTFCIQTGRFKVTDCIAPFFPCKLYKHLRVLKKANKSTSETIWKLQQIVKLCHLKPNASKSKLRSVLSPCVPSSSSCLSIDRSPACRELRVSKLNLRECAHTMHEVQGGEGRRRVEDCRFQQPLEEEEAEGLVGSNGLGSLREGGIWECEWQSGNQWSLKDIRGFIYLFFSFIPLLLTMMHLLLSADNYSYKMGMMVSTL